MRHSSILFPVFAGPICCVLLMFAAANAQDDPLTTGQSTQQPATSLDANTAEANQGQEKTFQEIVTEVRKNEKEINRLFSSIPIGFPQRQIEHMKQIETLKESTDLLKSQLEAAAFKAFRLDPRKNRAAVRIVFTKMLQKLQVAASDNSTYDPQGALEIAEMILQADLEKEPVGQIRFQDVAYQAFLASYAIEDFARADLMLKKIEDTGVPIPPAIRNKLADAQAKWQRELMIRRLESNTDDLPRVKLETSEGDIIVELFENHAPQTVGNFIHLVEKNFYNDLPFFLVRPSLIAQAGCPLGDGTGDAGYKIPCETERDEIRHYFTGTLGMANTGRDTGGSQFLITHQRIGDYDGKYTTFGRVIEGMDVVYRLNVGDGTKPTGFDSSTPTAPSTILKATVIRKRDHEYNPTRIAKNAETESDGSGPETSSETAANQKSGG